MCSLTGERVLISTLRIFYPLLPSPIKRVLRALLSLCGMTPPSAVASAAAGSVVSVLPVVLGGEGGGDGKGGRALVGGEVSLARVCAPLHAHRMVHAYGLM